MDGRTVGQHDPTATQYRRNRTTIRTVFTPLGMHDPQQAFPRAWCSLCGAEVYRPGTLLCRRCGPEHG